MRRFQRPPEFDNSDDGGLMNLTPLLDVLFVVLIMFILIAPILDLDRIDLSSSEGAKVEFANVNSHRPIKIYVHKDNSVWLGATPITMEKLGLTLLEMSRSYPNEIPELYCDQNSHFGTYQQIKNRIESAGFKELDIILKNE